MSLQSIISKLINFFLFLSILLFDTVIAEYRDNQTIKIGVIAA